jgi:sulfatase maturation enzyme AslB (radical SAM superfamily)
MFNIGSIVKLKDEYRIKGTNNDFCLLSLNSFERYSINDDQKNVIKELDGTKTLREIQEKILCEQEELLELIENLLELGLIEILTPRVDLNELSVGPNYSDSPYLREVHMDITSRCNLKCLHCYQEPYLKKEVGEMSTAENKRVIDQVGQLNAEKMLISGGEPFIREDLFELTDYAFQKGVIVNAIYTNGTYHDSDNLINLCRYGPPIVLAVSLDGSDRKSNDFLRGAGSFDKTMKFLEKIRQEKRRGESNYLHD